MKINYYMLALSCMLATGVGYAQNGGVVRNRTNFTTEGFDFNIKEGSVKPTAESIADNYYSPVWFNDIKFGIYMHWGLNSVSGYNGHYGRYLYLTTPKEQMKEGDVIDPHPTALYHREKFGHPSEFGYKDFIPMWKADKFDADKLSKLFKKSGAKFIGVMAVHHDNFDLYDSKYQPWNSYNMGPKIDIVGEWKRATEKAGLKFFVSSHLSNGFHEHRFYQGPKSDISGDYKGVLFDYNDPKYEGLYGKRTEDRNEHLQPYFAQQWFLRTKDLIDKYDPDLLYLDGTIPNGDYGINMAAHFYNSNFENGKQTAVLTIKKPIKGYTLDLECKGLNDIQDEPFLVDTSINPGWFYLGEETDSDKGKGDNGMGEKNDILRMDAGQIVDNLIDIVSKNGNMMLNVGPNADGSIHKVYEKELLKIGKWLEKNGEAIYGSRTYRVFGEGDFEISKEQLNSYADNEYNFTEKDIRYTTKPNTIYASVLGWPGDNATVVMRNVTAKDVEAISSVEMLSTGKKLEWELKADGLHVKFPNKQDCDFAHVVKICIK